MKDFLKFFSYGTLIRILTIKILLIVKNYKKC